MEPSELEEVIFKKSDRELDEAVSRLPLNFERDHRYQFDDTNTTRLRN